jgi:phosphoglycerate kinase
MNFSKQTVRDIDVDRQVVLVRVDYNVPLKKDGSIDDDLRIRASLPTIKYLIERQCKLVLMSHLGRPEGRDQSQSLAPVAARLSELLGQSVKFIDDCIGDKVYQTVKHAPCGSVILLENLRYYPQEEADDMEFAKNIAKSTGANLFVQDGFGAAHRAHASTHAITQFLPSFAGLLLEKEVTMINRSMELPARPFVAIIGGAKISDKIDLIKRFIDKADKILIGGAMANTFLKFKRYDMGKSLVELGQDEILREIYDLAAAKVGPENVDDFLILPKDLAVSTSIDDPDQIRREVSVDKIADDEMALDIGTQAIDQFCDIISTAKTIVWNGPMGIAEKEVFSIGSARIALAIAANNEDVSIVGGGDTADFVLKWSGGDESSFTHISTGGGASMELMSGKKLPGVESLLDAYGHRVVH